MLFFYLILVNFGTAVMKNH